MKNFTFKLDYSKIKSIAVTKNVTMLELAQEVGMSENGFNESIKSGNFKAKNVILVCEKLKISPNEFFGFDTNSSVTINQSGMQNSQTNNLSSISALEKQLEVKDSQISVLLDLLRSNGSNS